MLSIKNDTKDGDAEKAKEKENTDDRDKLLENLNHLDLLEVAKAILVVTDMLEKEGRS
jgi:hypothetical protein